MKRSLIILSCLLAVLGISGIVLHFVNVSKKPVEQTATNQVVIEKPIEKPQEKVERIKDAKLVAIGDEPVEREVVVETDIYKIVFDTKGASVKSIFLKNFKEKDGQLDLLLKEEESDRAFMLYEGRKLDDSAVPIDAIFNYELKDNEIVFEREFEIVSDKEVNDTVKVVKTFHIGKSDYMVAVKVDFIATNNTKSLEELNVDGYIYSLGFEPQIGPSFISSSSSQSRTNTRQYSILLKDEKKRDSIQLSKFPTYSIFTYENPFQWFELTGKYFSYIIAPKNQDMHITAFTTGTEKERNLTNSSYLSRPAQSQNVSDVFSIYLGPQIKSEMNKFNDPEENAFGVSNLHFEKGMENAGWLGWLQNFLKWIMSLFYQLIPNWGVSIILLTIVVKLLLYPLQHKSMKSSQKLGEITPKMNALKEQYKNDPQKLQEATMALYKEYNINPLSTMLPMLIQFPILIAMYGLLDKHFELRGSMFIPGWITDLSAPETVATISEGVPLIGGLEIHLLPIIYLGTMIFSMYYTQRSNGTTSTTAMQKFMTYGFPVIFFFILYNTSSGLLLYWTVVNLLSLLQQFIMNIVTKQKKIKEKEEKHKKEMENKPELYTGIVPPKAKKKER